MSYRLSTLSNGLRVATYRMPHAQTVALSLAVNAGTRSETEAQHGVAHFLEHMAFKGTTRRNARQIAEEFDAIGGNLNAYTSMEHTVYYARVLPDDLALAVDVLADIILHSCFDAGEMERERHVILQEIAMHHDTPEDMVLDYFTAEAFPGQPVGRSILGTEESITHMPRQTLMDFVGQHYTVDNMVLCASGQLEHDAFCELAEKHFAGAKQQLLPPLLAAHYVGGIRHVEEDLEQVHLLVGHSSISVHHPLYRAAQVLSTALGGGMSSRLFQEIREKRGLAYSVNAFVSSYADAGVMGIYSACGEKDAPEVFSLMLDEWHAFANTITQQELERAKNQLRASILMAQESTGSMCETLGRHVLYYGDYQPHEDVIRKLMAVSIADIRAVQELTLATAPTACFLGKIGQLPDQRDVAERMKG